MPATKTKEHRVARLVLRLVFWAGVALALVAALLLLTSRGEGSLRIAAVLAVLAVVLIGLSIAFRRDSGTIKLEMEETLLDEIDLLREDCRQDIGTAARATHRQFAEKLQALYESIEALRGQVEAVRGGYERVAYERADARSDTAESQSRHGTVGTHGVAGADGSAGRYGRAGSQAFVGAASVGGPSAPVGGGVVRHTETVQVTTRHTVVDPRGEGQPARGTVYGGTSYESPDATGRANVPAGRDRGNWDEPREESWTEQRLRERFGGHIADSRGSDGRIADSRGSEGRRGDGRSGDARDGDTSYRTDSYRGDRYGGDGRRRRDRDNEDDAGDDERWSGLRAGDRWASVRTDDRGRELRMGERRAAVHSGDSGTEVRIEDRWAAVRRDERRWSGDERWSDDRWPDERWSDERWSVDRFGPEVEDTGRFTDRRADRELDRDRRGPAALPASSSEPTWSQWSESPGWSTDGAQGEPSRSELSPGEDTRGGRRTRYREDDEPYSWQAERDDTPSPRARALRRIDFELSDDRWR